MRLKVVSIDRSLLKGEAPRFSADFAYPFSFLTWELFKFQRHLIQDFGCDELISINCANLL